MVQRGFLDAVIVVAQQILVSLSTSLYAVADSLVAGGVLHEEQLADALAGSAPGSFRHLLDALA